MGLSYSHGASYGWRARIGLLQPTVISDTNPFEFYLMAPTGVQMVLTSLGLVETNAENYARALADLETPVRRVLSRNVDSIMQTGVPPLVTKGWGIEEELRERVAKWTSVPYITDCAACIEAFKVLGASRIVLASGFDPATVDMIGDYLSHAGIKVVGSKRIRRSEGEPPTLQSVYRTARRAVQAANGAEAVWLTPASVPTVAVIDDLERDLGLPVVASAQALMWAALHMAGVREVVQGFGLLFDKPFRHSNLEGGSKQ